MSNPAVTAQAAMKTMSGSLPGDLGVELLEISDEGAVGRLLVDRRHLHAGGVVHGGCWTTFADTVAAWGTARHLAPGQGFTTVEMKTNVFAAARPGDELRAVGTPLHLGRRTQAWEVRVEARGRLAALFTCTQMLLDPPAP
jgi:uncharacterized protein (TIGR00369 family)